MKIRAKINKIQVRKMWDKAKHKMKVKNLIKIKVKRIKTNKTIKLDKNKNNNKMSEILSKLLITN